MKSAEDWMQLALELARQAEAIDEVPVGAVIVRDGELIGQGFNQTISSADPTAHAEIVALRDAAKNVNNYRLSGADMFVTIEPCSMCAGAMIHARINQLFYGAKEPRAGAVVSSIAVLDNPNVNHRVSHQGGVLETETSELISNFFRRKRQTA
jgi:tRNA(adenine34) deaminase